MEYSCLKEALLPLKESSKEAIADAMDESFDKVKNYLHIKLDIEEELLQLLNGASAVNSKQLILICGNVGDGKSHLLSLIRTNFPELLNGFVVHNDATESFSPQATNIDELNRLLEPFLDENVDKGSDKIILAINLGTLSNFLSDSAEGRFERLNMYVENRGILKVGEVDAVRFDPNSSFQFINFCDHNLFYLTADGPQPHLIDCAIERVTRSDEENPFYRAYRRHVNTHPDNCPIRYNFEFLQDPVNRENVSKLLIECIVKFQLIISIRALYNFIYDMIVPLELISLDCYGEKKRFQEFPAQDFLKMIIPNYLFEHPELSKIFRFLHYCDPAKRRSEQLDEAIIRLMVSDDPFEIFQEYIPSTIVSRRFMEASNCLFCEPLSPKNDFHINTFVRSVYFFKNMESFELSGRIYNDFMWFLYNYMAEPKKLIQLFTQIKQAALKWFGEADEDCIKIEFGRQQLEYFFSKSAYIKPVLPTIPSNFNKKEVSQFEVFMPLCFRVNNSKDDNPIVIPVNYRLFDIICKMKEGYQPTVLDHSDFVRFTKFIENIVDASDDNEKIIITESLCNRKFELKIDDFGFYCFMEVAE